MKYKVGDFVKYTYLGTFYYGIVVDADDNGMDVLWIDNDTIGSWSQNDVGFSRLSTK
jgi:hypothetical protein